ncbi:MAG: hypothetical protein IKM39_03180 [Clostridia bacterium]|nr:hypothetical protein [Clostridia bacterium]
MTGTWEELENKCYKYLQQIYGGKNSIEPFGKSDSTKADIKIVTESKQEFFVEVKAGNSQCCQFVLFPNEDTKQFDFSKRNKVPLSDNCKKIIAYMNGRYKTYQKVGKNGIPVNVDSSVLYGLVHDFYSSKNVKFFMTEGTDIIIFPSKSFSKYFDIEAFYRRKTSGSSEPNETTNATEIAQGLLEEGIVGTIEYKCVGQKTRCFLHTNLNLHKQKMICTDYTYQFKDNQYSKKVHKQNKNVFEVRRLSNTSNPNVICQLSLKNTLQNKDDYHIFKEIMNG